VTLALPWTFCEIFGKPEEKTTWAPSDLVSIVNAPDEHPNRYSTKSGRLAHRDFDDSVRSTIGNFDLDLVGCDGLHWYILFGSLGHG